MRGELKREKLVRESGLLVRGELKREGFVRVELILALLA